MCELLALNFEAPLSASFALQAFGARGEENPDGWGLAWYPDQSLALIKEPVQWSTSRLARFLENEATISSRTHLAHVRHKTVGDQPNHADTHPFTRELYGRDYVFAHNGTLTGGAWDLPLGRFLPTGQTDSERFFCQLLHQIESRSGQLECREDWIWLHQRLSDANQYGKLNALLSDGASLFVYHDRNGWKGLNFRQSRFTTNQPQSFEDQSSGLEAAANHGFVVATCPLSPTGWQPFELGELIVFGAGRMLFSSHRTTG
jgi:glutamine amidotransferase